MTAHRPTRQITHRPSRRSTQRSISRINKTSSDRQRGSAAIEFTIIFPVLILLFSVTVGGARAWFARAGTEQIAGAAARAASQARTAGGAETSARDLAAAQAAVGGLRCRPLVVTVDAAALSADAGQAGAVTATVTCDVPLEDVLVPGWPGSVSIHASASAVVDRYQRRP